MKNILRRLHTFFAQHGLNLLALANLRHTPKFITDILRYKLHPRASKEFPFKWKNLYPILSDLHDNAGTTRTHYFIQDLFMSRRVIKAAPKKHVDIGSRFDGFVAQLLASGMQVQCVDIRPLADAPEGLSFVQDDATTLATFADNSVESLSTLHVAEHFGLGRYGDPVDPESWRDYIANLARILKPGGLLYFSTPMGKQRVEFNAHRVFAPETLLSELGKNGLKVVEQAVITTKGALKSPADPLDYASEPFGCILLILTKPQRKKK